MKIILIAAVIIIINSITFSYDSMSALEDDWKNWQNEWKDSITSDSNGIRFSKRIDQKIGQPFAMPDIDSLEPDFGPYGIDWQADLSINSLGQSFQDYLTHLSWIFSPDNIDLAVSALASDIAEYYGQKQVVEQIRFYMNLAQGYDNLTTTIQNHRYEIARTLFDMGLSNTNVSGGAQDSGNIFGKSAEDNLRNWETNVNNAIRHKLIEKYSDDATALINFLSSSGTDKYADGADRNLGYRVDSILSALKTIYGVTLNAGNKAKTKAGVESVMHDTKSIFEKYCVYVINGRNFDAELDRFSAKYSYILGNNDVRNNIVELKVKNNGASGLYRKVTREFMYDVYHDLIITTIAQIDGIIGIIIDDNMRKRARNVCEELRNALWDYDIYTSP